MTGKRLSAMALIALAAVLLPLAALAAPVCSQHPQAQVRYVERVGKVYKDQYAHHVYTFREPYCSVCDAYIGTGRDAVETHCSLCDDGVTRVDQNGNWITEWKKNRVIVNRSVVPGSLEEEHTMDEYGVCTECGFTWKTTIKKLKYQGVTFATKETRSETVAAVDLPTMLTVVLQGKAHLLGKQAIGGLAHVMEKAYLYTDHAVAKAPTGTTYRNRTCTVVDVWIGQDDEYWYLVDYNKTYLWINAGYVEVELGRGDAEKVKYHQYRSGLAAMDEPEEPLYFHVTKAGRVRNRPSAIKYDPQAGDVVGSVAVYDTYEILDTAKDANGATWYQINYLGGTAWVAARLGEAR